VYNIEILGWKNLPELAVEPTASLCSERGILRKKNTAKKICTEYLTTLVRTLTTQISSTVTKSTATIFYKEVLIVSGW
jgi:hypothetical protein